MARTPPFLEEDLAAAIVQVTADEWRHLDGHRLFLTGGTGFVGKWMLASLWAARQRHRFASEVVVLSRNPQAFVEQVPWLAQMEGMSLVQGDMLDFDFPGGRFDAVVHAATDVAAGAEPIETFDACLSGTRRALQFADACGARRFLLVSSGAVYGEQPRSLEAIPETYRGGPDLLAARAGYGHGKRAAEWLANAWGIRHSLHVTTARLFAFMGPGMPLDSHFAAGNFVRAALEGRPITIDGDGTPLRTYLHASDMAGWLWALLLRGGAAQAYNVGSDEVVSISELARRISRIAGAGAPVTVKGRAVSGLGAHRYVPDVAKALDTLGLRKTLSLDETIERCARWYRDPPAR